jgi:hypothetical protein
MYYERINIRRLYSNLCRDLYHIYRCIQGYYVLIQQIPANNHFIMPL